MRVEATTGTPKQVSWCGLWVRSWIAPVVLFAAACFGTGTGNPFDDPPGGPEPDAAGEDMRVNACQEEEAQPLATVDADTALGFAAADVFAAVEGTYEISMDWIAHETLRFGPESGAGTVTIQVAYEAGAARYVQTTRREIDEETPGDGPIVDACPARVEVDVRVHVTTEGGALDEDFVGTVRAQTLDSISLAATWQWDALTGDLALIEQRDALAQHQASALRFRTVWHAQGVSGELSVPFEHQDEDASDVRVRLAQWPRQEPGSTDKPKEF